MGAFHSSGHLRGLFKVSANELRNIGSSIGVVFGDLIVAEYEPERDKEFEALKTHALLKVSKPGRQSSGLYSTIHLSESVPILGKIL